MSRKSSTVNKRKLRLEIYKRLVNFTCAHPQCQSGFNIEAHHVRPLFKGGVDKFWNIIALCSKCHRTNKLHSLSDEKAIELFTYKGVQERKHLGFYMDEEESTFKDSYRNAVLNCNRMEREEREAWAEIENVESMKEV